MTETAIRDKQSIDYAERVEQAWQLYHEQLSKRFAERLAEKLLNPEPRIKEQP